MAKQTSQLFHQQDFRPLKYLGQHFLRQKAVLTKIIAAASLKKSDLVIEIGPGLGVLTERLAQNAGRVFAIEKDSRLIPLLKEKFVQTGNVNIFEGDALKIKNWKAKTKNVPYKVVANLPYYAATRLIRQFLESPWPPKLMVVMLQKEVAQRICSQPPQMKLLAAAIRFYADAKIIASVPKTAFWPRPKIDSAVIKLETQSAKRKIDEKLFFKIVKAGFSQPRKTILNNLASKLGISKKEAEAWLSAQGISLGKRPGELSFENWLSLARSR